MVSPSDPAYPYAVLSGERFIYVIAGAGLLKIGISRDPERRVEAMRCGSPVALRLVGCFPGTSAEEAQLHDELAPFRVRGEWFQDCEEVRDQIDFARCLYRTPCDRAIRKLEELGVL
jgi:hypothetical protein